MPRNLARCAGALALSILGGCLFKADYDAGGFTCTDGVCPSGFTCTADRRCVRTAGGDAGPDGDAGDARIEALTCADPGAFPATGGTRSGTTVGRASEMSAQCAGAVMNGPDAVFRIALAGASQVLLVDVTGGRKAYVLSACTETPATPACLGNMRALAGQPISLTLAAGTYVVVVDDDLAAAASAFALTLTVN